jgi:thiamine biosynthesis protein ThiS
MHVFLNSNKIELETEVVCTLKSVLIKAGLYDKFFAIAINRRVILRHLYDETLLNEGDAIEVLTPMQGG